MFAKKIFTNTLAQIGSKLLVAVLSIAVIALLTDYLPQDAYGLYTKVYNYLSIFAVIADLGLYTIAVRQIAASDEATAMRIAGTVLTIRTVLGLGIIAIATGLAYFLEGYNTPMAITAVFITGWFTLFGLINSSLMSTLQAKLETEFSLVSTVLGKVINVGAIALIVWAFYPKSWYESAPSGMFIAFSAVMVAGLIGNVVMTVLLFWYMNRRASVRFGWDTSTAKTLFIESLPYGLAMFFSVVYFKADVIILSMLEPARTAAGQAFRDVSIALYSIPMKLVEVGMMFGTLFLNSLLPALSRLRSEGKHTEMRRYIGRAAELLFFFGMAATVFLWVAGREMVLLLAHQDYLTPLGRGAGSLDALYIVAPILVVYFLASLAIYALVTEERQKLLLGINATLTIVNIVGNIVVIPYASFIGSAWVTFMCQIALLVSVTVVSRATVWPWFSVHYAWRTILSLGVAGAGTWAFGQMLISPHPLLDFCAKGVVFGGLLMSMAVIFLRGEIQDIKTAILPSFWSTK